MTCFALTGSTRASTDRSANAFFAFERKRAETFPMRSTSNLEHGGRGDAARSEQTELRVACGGRGQITDVQQPR